MLKIWELLSGKKAAIGAVLLIIASMPHLAQWIGADIVDVIYYFGVALGGGGAVHRLVKIVKAFKAKNGD